MNDAAYIFALNTFDALATVTWSTSGQSQELNPLMAALIAHDPLTFLMVKILIGTVCSMIFYYTRSRRLSRIGAGYTMAILANILALHLLVLRLM